MNLAVALYLEDIELFIKKIKSWFLTEPPDFLKIALEEQIRKLYKEARLRYENDPRSPAVQDLRFSTHSDLDSST